VLSQRHRGPANIRVAATRASTIRREVGITGSHPCRKGWAKECKGPDSHRRLGDNPTLLLMQSAIAAATTRSPKVSGQPAMGGPVLTSQTSRSAYITRWRTPSRCHPRPGLRGRLRLGSWYYRSRPRRTTVTRGETMAVPQPRPARTTQGCSPLADQIFHEFDELAVTAILKRFALSPAPSCPQRAPNYRHRSLLRTRHNRSSLNVRRRALPSTGRQHRDHDQVCADG
jgi:hypothetical protein